MSGRDRHGRRGGHGSSYSLTEAEAASAIVGQCGRWHRPASQAAASLRVTQAQSP